MSDLFSQIKRELAGSDVLIHEQAPLCPLYYLSDRGACPYAAMSAKYQGAYHDLHLFTK